MGLAEALTRGTSIGGARPKVLLTDADRSLIAKFSSTTDIRPAVKAEGVAMELARRTGLNVAPTQIARVAGKDVLFVERFDRPGDGQRRHLVSALTILGLDEFTDDHPRNHAAFVNPDRSLTLTPAYDICPQPRSVPQANQAMAIGRNGERSSQLATCLAACQTYLLDTSQAQSIIDAQIDAIQAQWLDAADAARLTELERRQLLHREILNEYAFRT
jgi:serine/threonine-protein kinase HipA